MSTMRSFDELEQLWQAGPAESATRGAIRLIVLRKGGGRHECPMLAHVSVERGVEGDRWFSKADRDPEAQVTLMSYRAASLVAGEGGQLHMPGDNFLVELDLAEASLPAGTRLRLGGALLEVSSLPHTGCKLFRERFGMEALRWVNEHKTRRLRGVNCRVLADGPVTLGDFVEVVAQ
jgi:MOSC domain-containing protein YiiM